MPELPEVETVCRRLATCLPGLVVDDIEVHDPTVSAQSVGELRGALQGRRVVALRRRGKYVIIELEGVLLVIHLRMTGRLLLAPEPGGRRPRFVARFRFELGIEVALLPGLQHNAVGLEGLVVVGVDLDDVGSRPEERRVVDAALAGGNLADAQFLAGVEDNELDADDRLAGGIGDGTAEGSRLGLREQQSRRSEKEQKSIEPANHACLTVGSAADARPSRGEGDYSPPRRLLRLPRGTECYLK